MLSLVSMCPSISASQYLLILCLVSCTKFREENKLIFAIMKDALLSRLILLEADRYDHEGKYVGKLELANPRPQAHPSQAANPGNPGAEKMRLTHILNPSTPSP